MRSPQSQGTSAPTMPTIVQFTRHTAETLDRPASSAFTRVLRGRLGSVWHLLPALIPALLFLPAVLAPPLNHDVAAVLNFSQRWLAGEHLYSDLLDVNPPLVFVLNLVPAAIERMAGLDAVYALQACVLAWGAFAWFLSLRVRDRAREGAAERRFLDVLPAYFLLAGGYDFGQREHLMAVAALPYLVAASRREAGRASGGRDIAAALFAAIGFALKPHFLAVPAMVEIVVLLGRMRRGPADAIRRTFRDGTIWTMAGVFAAYLASLPLLFPNYLGQVVPLVWDYYLDLGGLTVWEVMKSSRLACIELVMLATLCMVPRLRFVAVTARARVLLAASLGALASALAQHKGWSYHIVPVEHFTLALAFWLAARWLDTSGADLSGRRAIHAAAAFGGVFSLYVISNGEAPWKEIDYRKSPAYGLTALLDKYAAGKDILVLSPGIYPVYPAVNYTHAHVTLRSMNMWLIEGAYETCLADGRRYRDAAEMGQAEGRMYRAIVADFVGHPPAAVVVDRQPGIPWCGSEFDFLAYLQRDNRFANAFASYRKVAEWDRYKVFARPD